MLVDIYNTTISANKHLTVRAGTDVESVTLPDGTDPAYASLKPFRQNFEIIPGEPHVALDAADVVAQIEAKGYALHASSTKIVHQGFLPS